MLETLAILMLAGALVLKLNRPVQPNNQRDLVSNCLGLVGAIFAGISLVLQAPSATPPNGSGNKTFSFSPSDTEAVSVFSPSQPVVVAGLKAKTPSPPVPQSSGQRSIGLECCSVQLGLVNFPVTSLLTNQWDKINEPVLGLAAILRQGRFEAAGSICKVLISEIDQASSNGQRAGAIALLCGQAFQGNNDYAGAAQWFAKSAAYYEQDSNSELSAFRAKMLKAAVGGQVIDFTEDQAAAMANSYAAAGRGFQREMVLALALAAVIARSNNSGTGKHYLENAEIALEKIGMTDQSSASALKAYISEIKKL